MKRPLSIALFFLILTTAAFSQYFYGGPSLNYRFPQTGYMSDSTGNILFKPGETHFGMEIGTGFGSNFSGSSIFSTWAAPSFSYNVSKRFRLNAGVSVNNYYGNAYYTNGFEYFNSPVKSSNTTTSIYVQGDYLLSNKFMISGAAYKSFSPGNIGIKDPRLKIPDSQGVMLNLNYRPTEHFEINASFEYGNGNSPYYSPFAPRGMYNPW